ncbi:unnamed protein product [Zymoseptoria tritici ST99CH_1E4]|uniref:Uncharacterized protein n=1 Tax=Zymoseptoria tritici ST99CH_1E4 TaxID=1276532 RepID=A0A2H1H9D5_ZYMTR|nr:unnamed protein product [Zymoseptoria tritici ST99CH_1E4]
MVEALAALHAEQRKQDMVAEPVEAMAALHSGSKMMVQTAMSSSGAREDGVVHGRGAGGGDDSFKLSSGSKTIRGQRSNQATLGDHTRLEIDELKGISAECPLVKGLSVSSVFMLGTSELAGKSVVPEVSAAVRRVMLRMGGVLSFARPRDGVRVSQLYLKASVAASST